MSLDWEHRCWDREMKCIYIYIYIYAPTHTWGDIKNDCDGIPNYFLNLRCKISMKTFCIAEQLTELSANTLTYSLHESVPIFDTLDATQDCERVAPFPQTRHSYVRFFSCFLW